MKQKLIIRGAVLDCLDDPATHGEQALRYFPDGALYIEDGYVRAVGEANNVISEAPVDIEIRDYGDKFIIPGMIDVHIHFPQTEMIASYGEQLLTWLTDYAFPTEQKFTDVHYAKQMAECFLAELLRNGTTTALVIGTVHPQSVDAFFSVARDKNLRMIAGKVLMNRSCPESLQDSVESGYSESKALIEKWHNVKRLSYAVTPRFAPTSTFEQLHMCGKLLDEFPGVYLHTHLSENRDECEWVQSLFPTASDYLEVYEQAQLVRKRSIFAHGIYLSDRELKSLSAHQSTIAHCPTSNLFIGSGLFDLKRCHEYNIPVGMGTDVGAGTSFSLFQTYNEAYKIQQLQKYSLSAFEGFYLNTLGGARALDLEGVVGNFTIGNEADFVVIDDNATDIMRLRNQNAQTLHEKLFGLMMLADDRAIMETWAMGALVHQRDKP